MLEPTATGLVQGSEQTQVPKDAALNKACEYCRGLKVRCFPEPGSSSTTCQRCARSQRLCVFAPPQKRKQRKRTDARVAELEKEMKALRSLLKLGPVGDKTTEERLVSRQPERTSRSTGDTSLDTHGPSWDTDDNSNQSPEGQISTGGPSPKDTTRRDLDVIERGLLPMATASALYNTYVNELIPHYPAVAFPENYTAGELRRERPILFLAVLSAASAKTDPKLYTVLNGELLQLFASRSMSSREKTLEFVQAMLLTAVWYRPGDDFDQLKFYQYIHMAATIALDIGLGSRPYTRTNYCTPLESTVASDGTNTHSQNSVSPQSTEDGIDVGSLDAKRTILVCYLICSGVAISMRRQNMLRFNSWMRECLAYLDTNPMATTFDKFLVARVRLQNIAEEFSSALSLDDPDDTSVVLDSRTQLTVKAFERRLKEWRDGLSPEITNPSMLMIYYQTNILLHEVAIRDDHPSATFKPPYSIRFSPPEAKSREKLTATDIEAVMRCVTFSHDLLDTFLSLDLDTLRSFPVYKFVMVCYAVLILTKLTQSIKDPRSEIGKVLDHSSLALDSYSDATIAQVSKAAGSEGFIVPSKFLGVLMCFRAVARGQRPNFGNMKTGNEAQHPLRQLTTFPTNPPSSNYPDVNTPPSFTTNPHQPSGTVHSMPALVTRPDMTAAHINGERFAPNVHQSFQTSEHPLQYSREHMPSFTDSQPIETLGINYDLDMDPSTFSGLPQNSNYFTGDLDNWIPPSSVTAHALDEQMLDLPYWGFSNQPDG